MIRNEIFVGAKVIYQHEIWIVRGLPVFLNDWCVDLERDGEVTLVSLDRVIMPDGLNENAEAKELCDALADSVDAMTCVAENELTPEYLRDMMKDSVQKAQNALKKARG